MQSVVITGASSGIGLELVKIFCNKGFITFGLSRNEESLQKLRQDLISPENYFPITVDLTDENQLIDAVQIIKQNVQNLNYLINNAGILINQPFLKFNRSQVHQLFSSNVFSAIELTEKLFPLLCLSKFAHVVNISSMGGFQGSVKFPGLSVYASTKAAIANLSEGWAAEWTDTVVKSNALALGAVQTKMLREAFPDYEGGIQPILMANYIYDFTTKAHQYLNGKIIPVSLSTP